MPLTVKIFVPGIVTDRGTAAGGFDTMPPARAVQRDEFNRTRIGRAISRRIYWLKCAITKAASSGTGKSGAYIIVGGATKHKVRRGGAC